MALYYHKLPNVNLFSGFIGKRRQRGDDYIQNNGGGGGIRTPVRKFYTAGATCLVWRSNVALCRSAKRTNITPAV